MEDSKSYLQVANIIIFVVLTSLGVLFLMAAPVDPSVMVIRFFIGIALVTIALLIFIIVLLFIQRSKYKVVKVSKTEKQDKQDTFIPSEIICSDCSNPIEISDDIRNKESVICEKCGNQIKIPKSDINW